MIFFEGDKTFSLKTDSFTSGELDKGLWIVLAGVNETPPHIALISDGKYYSVSTKKVDNESPAEIFIQALNRKKIPALFIGIKTGSNVIIRNETRPNGSSGRAILPNLLFEIYKDLQPLGVHNETCLSPIKEVFKQYFSPEFTEVNYVFELLALAEKKGLLENCISLNCVTPNSNVITLPKYSMAQIRNRINQLSTPITSIK